VFDIAGVAGSEGTVGAVAVEPTGLAKGAIPGVGTAAAELTPALLISEESKGMPVRGTAPMLVDEVDEGVDDAFTLLEPDPHIPDSPDVSIIADGDVGGIVDDIAGAAAVVPVIPPVAGAADPAPVPPPSNMADDPNISLGPVPTVEHTAPLLGMAIVPVAGAASGLTPPAVTSVAPSAIPGGETGDPAPSPSGDVALMLGVGVDITAICAWATFPASGTRIVVNIAVNRIVMTLPSHPWRDPRAAAQPHFRCSRSSDGRARSD
jgi:hypothetical protein